ncbi:hypothetical protein NXS19_004180 [Fusarium pseudograminearum]|nr:hypothetical protein NXS19_004180 [Fusarium pseudograminearum]
MTETDVLISTFMPELWLVQGPYVSGIFPMYRSRSLGNGIQTGDSASERAERWSQTQILTMCLNMMKHTGSTFGIRLSSEVSSTASQGSQRYPIVIEKAGALTNSRLWLERSWSHLEPSLTAFMTLRAVPGSSISIDIDVNRLPNWI